MKHTMNWTLGTCAAAAAGVVGGNSAHADIIVSTAPPVVSAESAQNYDIDQDGATDFGVEVVPDEGAQRYYIKNINTDGSWMYGTEDVTNDFPNTTFQVKPFEAGELIGPSEAFSAAPGDAAADDYSNNFAGVDAAGGGLFDTDGSVQYLGYSWDPNGDDVTDYGWAAVSFTDPTGPETFSILSAAYEDSGAAIAAGDTGVIPEPASLALLALGAGGMMLRRR